MSLLGTHPPLLSDLKVWWHCPSPAPQGGCSKPSWPVRGSTTLTLVQGQTDSSQDSGVCAQLLGTGLPPSAGLGGWTPAWSLGGLPMGRAHLRVNAHGKAEWGAGTRFLIMSSQPLRPAVCKASTSRLQTHGTNKTPPPCFFICINLHGVSVLLATKKVLTHF